MSTTDLWKRNLPDATFRRVQALPAGGATNYSAVVDVGEFSAPALECATLRFTIPATPLPDGKAIVFTVLDGDEEAAPFAETDPRFQIRITGASGTGTPARVVEFPLPPAIKRYVVIQQTADADAGEQVGATELQLLF